MQGLRSFADRRCEPVEELPGEASLYGEEIGYAVDRLQEFVDGGQVAELAASIYARFLQFILNLAGSATRK